MYTVSSPVINRAENVDMNANRPTDNSTFMDLSASENSDLTEINIIRKVYLVKATQMVQNLLQQSLQ